MLAGHEDDIRSGMTAIDIVDPKLNQDHDISNCFG